MLLCASLHISDEPYLNATLYVPREAISAYSELVSVCYRPFCVKIMQLFVG